MKILTPQSLFVRLKLNELLALSHLINEDEPRSALQGILVECHPDHCLLVATDGHALARLKVKPLGQVEFAADSRFTIPFSALQACAANPSARAENYVSFDYSPASHALVCRLPDGTALNPPIVHIYPDWRAALPQKPELVADPDNTLHITNFLRFHELMSELDRAIPIRPRWVRWHHHQHGLITALELVEPNQQNAKFYGLIMPVIALPAVGTLPAPVLHFS